MAELLTTINDTIWSTPLVMLFLAAGIFFTLRTGLIQVLGLPDFFRQIRREKASQDGLSPFQTLMVSMAARVGIGNIAGVATAIAFGGPGAVFWMWVMGFLGAATSFIECTLAQIYKERDPETGQYRGGPAFYIEKAYAHTKAAPILKILALVVAAIHAIATIFFLPSMQANGIANAVTTVWHLDARLIGLILALLLAVIVVGGVQRIAQFASFIVPFMASTYIIIALIIMLSHATRIPEVCELIFKSAFGKEEIFAGITGSAFAWGIRRGVYSNEAGQGNGAMFAGSAEVSHPVKQGFVQAVSVYVDTLLVCSATAFIIISTDMFNVYSSTDASGNTPLLYHGALGDNTPAGPNYVQAGLDTFIAGTGPAFVAIAICFFGFTSAVACYYLAETNLSFLLRSGVKRRGYGTQLPRVAAPFSRRISFSRRIAQGTIIAAMFIGATSTPGAAWLLGDIGMGSLAWFNLIIIVALHRVVITALKDYRRQRAQGLDPQFHPEKLGIKNAEFWVG
ncbi:alanine:cation symporter family protein [Corynebacterium sp. sy017]|uniref:alanine/glycine:cation symporter family protein n=1 Tax=unclassified Corynebacterium TaxID=2624378 RepID=UPI0011855336|nr:MULTISPECIES: alanine/glycine:cation symporter family protein [unclassified Corynebacterium]MBP3088491.1 alanine:cation symporter family protein [Corynebacterium sp. sy017]TSD91796.1 alanine:cation symporter family protein [Corynebacterium sp. SY003]